MFAGIIDGERTLLSEADIVSVAQAGGFTQVNLNPTRHVPEPMGLVWMGLLSAVARMRSLRRPPGPA